MTNGTHPSPSLDETEAVAARGATGQRITLSFIKNNIAMVRYALASDMTLEDLPSDHPFLRLTLCFVVTRAGFVVVGTSAPIDPQNFDAEKGKTFAYEDALKQLWPLFAFAELERAHRLRAAASVPLAAVQGEGGPA